MHEQPGVYVTDQLPDMQELSGSNTPTRPLNDFEANGLENIVAGEDVVVRATLNRIVMLGSIRAEASCLECHAVKENDLLGAFSYELIRKPQIGPSEQY